jgi:hypothetical protein
LKENRLARIVSITKVVKIVVSMERICARKAVSDMARYIDADKLIAHLKDEIKACEPKFGGRANGKSVAYGTELGLKSAISFAETLATADVAPKSEVAREIFEEIEKVSCTISESNPNGFVRVVCYQLSAEKFDELKKKYTEEKK